MTKPYHEELREHTAFMHAFMIAEDLTDTMPVWQLIQLIHNNATLAEEVYELAKKNNP